MAWKEIQQRFRELLKLRDSGVSLTTAWQAYRDTVLKTRHETPYHLLVPVRLAESAAAKSGPESVRILDHGCGGGSTLLYLLALGYKGIYGIDVGNGCTKWNSFLRDEFGITEQRFFEYEGQNLPFANETFDVLISEEVVEHVPDAVIDNYYSEGARVLRPEGIAYYTVPHRLGPYDSHSQTWLIHYLPRPLACRAYDLMSGNRRPFFENHLFLRWPGFHRKMMQSLYGSSVDLTQQRLQTLTQFDYYDGPRRLREIIGTASRIPGAGAWLNRAIGALLMRQTLSRKVGGAFPAIYSEPADCARQHSQPIVRRAPTASSAPRPRPCGSRPSSK